MNAKEVSQLNMLSLIINICDGDKTIVATNKAFYNAYQDLKVMYNNIIDTAEAQGKVLTGVTVDKNVDKENAIQAGLHLANNLAAYATEAKNNTLFQQTNLFYSTFSRMPGTSLIAKLNDIHTLATDNLAALADANVTDAILVNYQAKIDQYQKSLTAPRGAISKKTTDTDVVNQSVKDAMDIERKRMNTRISSFNIDNADFVALYKSSRKVIKTAAGTKKNVQPTNKKTDGPGEASSI